jgi:hypothetical protein
MLLAKIQESILLYKKWLQTTKRHPRLYRWESLQHFQTNWNLEDPDFAAMYDRSLYNTETRRLWQTENWYPKRMMLEFCQMEPQTVRLMFIDLFNETKDIEARAGRFLFGCDELLRSYKQKNIATVENNHYHGDFRMISLYLAFNYPAYYTPYDLTVFQKTLIHLGARDIPGQNDIGRFFKVMRTLTTFLEKDGSIQHALNSHLEQRRHYQGKTLMLTDDFCHFVAGER